MAEPTVHKGPNHFYFDFSDAPKTLDEILDCLNKKQYDNLDKLLKSIDWELIGKDLIDTTDVRYFTKCISDEEVRLDVMKFLKKYAKQYFRKAAEDLEYKEHVRVSTSVALVRESVKSADENLVLFENELGYLIEQLVEGSHFTGEKFKKQQERIKQLEKMVEDLVAKQVELEKTIKEQKQTIYKSQHPEIENFIPDQLDEPEFYYIMEYLDSKHVVKINWYPGNYGPRHICYDWLETTSYALFGYLVDRVSFELDLRKNTRLNWKLFKPAFRNYKTILKQGKDAVSKYKFWAEPQGELPENYA